MKTDTIFYKIFLDCPEIFFELINEPTDQVAYYEFSPQELSRGSRGSRGAEENGN